MIENEESPLDEIDFPDFDPETGQLVDKNASPTNSEPDPKDAEIARLKAELERKPAASAPTTIVHAAPAPAASAPAVNLDDLNAKLAAEILTKPAEFLSQYKRQIIEELRGEQLPGKTASVKRAVQSFRRSVESDPMFPQAAEYFDNLVGSLKPEVIKNLDESQLDDILEEAYNSAVGKAIRTGSTRVSRDSEPPPYSVGSSPSTAKISQGKRGPLTREERDLVDAARAMGQDDGAIAKMLAENRRGNR